MARQTPPDQPVRPAGCGQCGSEDTEPHCDHPRCPWSECPVCGVITGYVLGQIRIMPSLNRQWHKGRS